MRRLQVQAFFFFSMCNLYLHLQLELFLATTLQAENIREDTRSDENSFA